MSPLVHIHICLKKVSREALLVYQLIIPAFKIQCFVPECYSFCHVSMHLLCRWNFPVSRESRELEERKLLPHRSCVQFSSVQFNYRHTYHTISTSVKTNVFRFSSGNALSLMKSSVSEQHLFTTTGLQSELRCLPVPTTAPAIAPAHRNFRRRPDDTLLPMADIGRQMTPASRRVPSSTGPG